ncbi:MAG TPA: serine hydrolase domain-containing protein [Geminicoccaceae bacterium]
MSPALASALQEALDAAVHGDPPVTGGVMQIETPDFHWAGAAGMADPDLGDPLRPDDQFQAASITKMITAAALMMLVEDGRLGLDQGIGRHLPGSVLDGLHEGRHVASISPRQLLSHTSGVADYFGDGLADAGGRLPFVGLMLEEPDRLWGPLDLLDWTRRNLRPHVAPGQGWHYADTGYVLAGLLIERLAGMPLHEVFRERMFAPLGMAHTYMLHREPARPVAPGRAVARASVGEVAYGTSRSVSADWGGGGLVTTAGDLSRFLRAFVAGAIFRRAATRTEMLRWIPTGERGVQYGLGVRRFVLDQLGLPGMGELWGHTGFLKSFMLYWPARDLTLCGTLNQSAAAGAFSRLRPAPALVPATLVVLDRHLGGHSGGRAA